MSTRDLRLTRRRFISIAAAAGVLPNQCFAADLPVFSWSGVALGAQASLKIQHHDKSKAMAAIAACLAEVARLEAIFSLFREGSALCKLNADGCIDTATADLRDLLSLALSIAERSDGAFDPTVQPLWQLYAQHFNDEPDSADGPSPSSITAALQCTGWNKVRIDGATIRFTEPGMAVTLNGIAQGYITDKVADILKSRGFLHVLINMGELRVLGPQANGHAWSIGIADPASPKANALTLPITRGAVATSGAYGCHFDASGRYGHILDPATGQPAETWASVTVFADSATLADALSTALAVAPEKKATALLSFGPRAFVIPKDGSNGRWL